MKKFNIYYYIIDANYHNNIIVFHWIKYPERVKVNFNPITIRIKNNRLYNKRDLQIEQVLLYEKDRGKVQTGLVKGGKYSIC